jgi:hypothetical protein
VELAAFLALATWATDGAATRIFKDGFEVPESALQCPGATPMVQDENGLGGVLFTADGVIDPPGDSDYFSVPLMAGEWIQVLGSRDPPESLAEPVVSVFPGDGTVLLARDALTPHLLYRATQTSNHCLRVEDLSTFQGLPPEGGSDYGYALSVLPIDFELYDEFNVDTEPNDLPGGAQTGLSAVGFPPDEFAWISGVFGSDGDVDVFALHVGADVLEMDVEFTPSGTTGHGGTVDIQNLEVLSGDGSSILAMLDATKGTPRGIRLPVQQDTTYLVRVGSPTLPLGDNPFYSIAWRTRGTQNQQESDDAGNGAAAGAEVATPIISPFQTSHFIGGTLSGASDTDWWSFQAEAGSSINVFCSSWRVGSGVRDATVALFDDPGTAALQQEVEVETVDLAWADGGTLPPVPATTTGTHYLRLSASTFSSSVTSRHYVCGFHVVPP